MGWVGAPEEEEERVSVSKKPTKTKTVRERSSRDGVGSNAWPRDSDRARVAGRPRNRLDR